jgi:hypothetical protein
MFSGHPGLARTAAIERSFWTDAPDLSKHAFVGSLVSTDQSHQLTSLQELHTLYVCITEFLLRIVTAQENFFFWTVTLWMGPRECDPVDERAVIGPECQSTCRGQSIRACRQRGLHNSNESDGFAGS